MCIRDSLDVVDSPLLLAMVHAGLVDVLHDAVQALVHFAGAPVQTHGVLAHFQAAGGHATGVGGLARRVADASLDEQIHRFQGRGHIGPLGHADAAVFQQRAGVLAVQLVLRRAGQRDVCLLYTSGPDAWERYPAER